MTTLEDGSILTDDGWWFNTGPCVEGCLPVMIANVGWEHGYCAVEIEANNSDGSPAEDVMVTTALMHNDKPIGLPDESGWNAARKFICDELPHNAGFVVWFTPVNGRDEPWSIRVRGLTV